MSRVVDIIRRFLYSPKPPTFEKNNTRATTRTTSSDLDAHNTAFPHLDGTANTFVASIELRHPTESDIRMQASTRGNTYLTLLRLFAGGAPYKHKVKTDFCEIYEHSHRPGADEERHTSWFLNLGSPLVINAPAKACYPNDTSRHMYVGPKGTLSIARKKKL